MIPDSEPQVEGDDPRHRPGIRLHGQRAPVAVQQWEQWGHVCQPAPSPSDNMMLMISYSNVLKTSFIQTRMIMQKSVFSFLTRAVCKCCKCCRPETTGFTLMSGTVSKPCFKPINISTALSLVQLKCSWFNETSTFTSDKKHEWSGLQLHTVS